MSETLTPAEAAFMAGSIENESVCLSALRKELAGARALAAELKRKTGEVSLEPELTGPEQDVFRDRKILLTYIGKLNASLKLPVKTASDATAPVKPAASIPKATQATPDIIDLADTAASLTEKCLRANAGAIIKPRPTLSGLTALVMAAKVKAAKTTV